MWLALETDVHPIQENQRFRCVERDYFVKRFWLHCGLQPTAVCVSPVESVIIYLVLIKYTNTIIFWLFQEHRIWFIWQLLMEGSNWQNQLHFGNFKDCFSTTLTITYLNLINIWKIDQFNKVVSKCSKRRKFNFMISPCSLYSKITNFFKLQSMTHKKQYFK